MFTVKVPATSANLGPGFDTLGLALDLYLRVDVELSGQTGEITWQGEGRDQLSESNGDNLLNAALKKVFAEAGSRVPDLSLTIRNEIPIGKGLGSSAAAITAGMLTANRILQGRFPEQLLLKWAVEMEGHADNLVPAFVGGLTTSMVCKDEVFYQKITFPQGIKIVLQVPDFEMSTEKSRQFLPPSITRQEMVANLQQACFLLASIANDDFCNLGRAMDDLIIQPLRQQNIPGYKEVVKRAMGAGALGVAISGSGPSLLAFTGDPERVGQAMQQAFSEYDIKSRTFYVNVCPQGACLE